MHHVQLQQETRLDKTSLRLRKLQPGEHSPGGTKEIEEVMDRRRLCIRSSEPMEANILQRPPDLSMDGVIDNEFRSVLQNRVLFVRIVSP